MTLMTTNALEFNTTVPVYALIVLIVSGLIKLWVMVYSNKQKIEDNKTLLSQKIGTIKEQQSYIKDKIKINSVQDKKTEERVNNMAQAIVRVETEVKNIKQEKLR